MRASRAVFVFAACLVLVAAGAGAAVETIDFSGLPAGTIVSEIFIGGADGGPSVKVNGVNDRFPGRNTAIIFDSANPTGGDFDLGAPNETFEVDGKPGPGRGRGGVKGAPYENRVPLGKLLIIAENMIDADGDGRIDDPDDEGELRTVDFELDFSEVGPVTIHRMVLIDVEDRERTPTVRLEGAGGVPLFGRDLVITDNNGVALIPLGPTAGVLKMVVELHGSGGIASIVFEHSGPPRPGIDIEKLTNGRQADLPTGEDVPFVPLGQPVTWTYIVTNTGGEQLQNVTVTDDRGAAVECPKNTLEPGETMECTATGVALDLVRKDLGFEPAPGTCRSKENQPVYGNVGSVSGVGTISELTVSDSDPSHYCSAGPEPPRIYVRKQRKGPDTRRVASGDRATFEIFVKNTGGVDLTNVKIVDVLSPDCDREFPSLAAGESRKYTCTAPALTLGGDGEGCRLVNEVVATGYAGDRAVTDRDTSTIELAGLEIEKTFKGVDQKAAHFEIKVTNRGCPVDGVRVTDELAPDCARRLGALGTDESETYACSMALEFVNEACAEAGAVSACDSVTFEVGDGKYGGPGPGGPGKPGEPGGPGKPGEPGKPGGPDEPGGPGPGDGNGDDAGGPKKASNWLLLLALALLIGGGLFAWNRMKAG